MQGFYFHYSAPTASFRDPGSQMYHSCLPLPPFSTLVGIAGAALGMSFECTINHFRHQHIFAGVKGVSGGHGIDLWNYAKITNNSVVGKDILNREFMAYLEGEIFYASPNSEVINELHNGFQSPVFCLTLGSSDDLFVKDDISPVIDVGSTKTHVLQNCMIPADISGLYEFDWSSIKESPLTIQLRAPQVFFLPVDYEFRGLVRKGSKYQVFSYVPGNIRLRSAIEVYRFGEETIPLFAIN
ncbi:MAG: CRISPR-associated protein Cas5 [Syntrophomonadaceae bacterium]|jgi:CRISPR-associated protein Cas5t